jgi:hypothetical protein
MDEPGIAWQRIAEKILTDSETYAHNLAGVRREGRGLYPHVMGG